MIREKHRWVAFEIIGDKVTREEFIKAFRRKAIELFGTFGIADMNVLVIEFDEDNGRGVLRVPLKAMDMLRTTLFFLREINGKNVLINEVLVSGTLKALKRKLKGRFWKE